MDKQSVIERLMEKKRKHAELEALLDRNYPPEESAEIKKKIGEYYFEKLTNSFHQQAKEEGWNEETYRKWAQEHFRTPYEPA